eukprot:scaffold11894_cov53-Attheya_sp.AAC.10
MSQKEKEKVQAQQPAWRSPPPLANAKKRVSCCPPASIGKNVPTNGLLNFLRGKDAANGMPVVELTRPSSCHAVHKGTGLLSSMGENGLTNGMCCIGYGLGGIALAHSDGLGGIALAHSDGLGGIALAHSDGMKWMAGAVAWNGLVFVASAIILSKKL